MGTQKIPDESGFLLSGTQSIIESLMYLVNKQWFTYRCNIQDESMFFFVRLNTVHSLAEGSVPKQKVGPESQANLNCLFFRKCSVS